MAPGSSGGALSLAASRSDRKLREVALAYARLADARLRLRLRETPWDRVLGAIGPSGRPTRKVALDAFALAVGALPGVRVPRQGVGTIRSATPALRWIGFYRSSLSPQLRDAVDRATARLFGLPVTEAQQAQASEGTLTFSPSATQTAREVRAIIEGRWMGASLQTIPLVYASDRPAATDTPGVTARAATILRPGVECRIVIYPRAAQDRGIDLQFTIAHEVMHCYQRELLGATAYNALPDWRAEGTADWAAFDVTGIDHDTKGGLVSYALMPRTSLFRRSYDASGFFGHLQEQAVNVWSTLTRTLLAADDPAAYAEAGANEAFLDTWGSSMYRHGAFGPEWTFTKPVPVPESLPTPVTPIVNRGTATNRGLLDRALHRPGAGRRPRPPHRDRGSRTPRRRVDRHHRP